MGNVHLARHLILSAEVRFWAKVNKTDRNGCWLWTGCLTNRGYGQIKVDGRTVKAHRFAYELDVGPIPCSEEIGHTCNINACVNREHLVVGSHSEHMKRTFSGELNWEALKTHCPQGHPYDDENTQRYGPERKWRHCRVCQRERMARLRQSRRGSSD